MKKSPKNFKRGGSGKTIAVPELALDLAERIAKPNLGTSPKHCNFLERGGDFPLPSKKSF